MGGIGSGSTDHWWRPDKKTTVESCRRLDANRWHREGILRPGVRRDGRWVWWTDGRQTEEAADIGYAVDTTADPPAVRLSYIFTQSGQRLEYPVQLVTTRPHFGGVRWWFVCPLWVNCVPCGRRVGKLYMPPGARYFGCRRCHDLVYTSSQESGRAESLARAMARRGGGMLAEAMEIFRTPRSRQC